MRTHVRKGYVSIAVSLLSSACGMIGLDLVEEDHSEELPSAAGGWISTASGGAGTAGGGGANNGFGGGGDEVCALGATFCDGLVFTTCESDGTTTSENCALASQGTCTRAFCDNLLGCGVEPLDEGEPCDDGLSCSTGDVCIAGACRGETAGSCDALVASYDFEGNVMDGTLNGNNASIVSSVSYESGISGQALRLDSRSSVVVPDSESLDVSGELTVEAWVFPEMISSTERAGVIDNDGQWGLFILPGGQVRCRAIQTVTSPLPISVGKWTHLSCVYDLSFIRLYVEGKQVAQVPAMGPIPTGSSVAMAIGANSPSGDQFTGLIDTLRIWRSALDPGDICRSAGACP